MAEGLLGRILGDEAEKPQVEVPEAVASAEGFAAVVAAIASRQDPAATGERTHRDLATTLWSV